MAARYSAMYTLRSKEAESLRATLAASDSTIAAQRKAIEGWEHTQSLWRKVMRRQRRRSTGKTALWGAGLGLLGFAVGTVMAR